MSGEDPGAVGDAPAETERYQALLERVAAMEQTLRQQLQQQTRRAEQAEATLAAYGDLDQRAEALVTAAQAEAARLRASGSPGAPAPDIELLRALREHVVTSAAVQDEILAAVVDVVTAMIQAHEAGRARPFPALRALGSGH